jgi:hypothetical protein
MLLFDEFDVFWPEVPDVDCANAKLPAAKTAAAKASRRMEGFEDFIAP